MSAQCEVTLKRAAVAPMSTFERYLSLWVFTCIVAGIAFGQALPGVFQAIGRMEVAQVNLPVGLLIWVMIIPMLVKVDFGALHEVRQHVRGIGVTLFVNWLVKPFSMAFLGWLFIRQLFAPWLPAEQLDSYIAGLILLAAAPCTAMVFVWSRLSNGDPLFTLSQVAVNDAIMVFAFAPLVAFLLGLSAITVPWDTLVTSVVLYIVIPLALAELWRAALLKIDFGALHEVRRHWRGIGVTLFVNWAVKPFSMALLAWVFVRHLFAPWLPAEQLDSYIAGLILLAAAPCTAMVFVWSRLSNGDPLFTLSQVAVNDAIMVFAFAPLVAFLLGLSAITVPWDTLLISVVLYIVIPVALAQWWRKALLARGQAAFDAALAKIGPWSITALLATLILLFAFQGEAILRQPLVIALLAVPILIQVFFNSALAYWLNRVVGEKHNIACPSALIGASNFFELAVAAAISLFGFESGAALATVVGVLIEVPVMLLVVRVVNASKGWYERA